MLSEGTVHAWETVVEELLPELTQLRRDLHRHPELGYQETRTAQVVAEWLTPLGLDLQTGVGDTGVVVTLTGDPAGPLVVLRADMDALPLTERTGLPYASLNPGRMHACGHDGHTAILVGTVQVLARWGSDLPGRVRFLFQPAEEGGAGAYALCEAGVLEGANAIFGLHSWPGLEVGQIGLTYGPMLAAADRFEITVHGQGGHGARPHESIDPILIGAKIVDALQVLLSREVNPVDAVVVTVGQIHGGTAANVIPDQVWLEGTIRTLRADTRQRVPARLRAIAEQTAAAFRARAEVVIHEGYPPLVNTDEMVDLIAAVGREVLGEENVVLLREPSLGSEDFSFYLQRVPGAFFRLGIGTDSPPLHNAHFDFNDAALKPGILMLTALAWAYLTR